MSYARFCLLSVLLLGEVSAAAPSDSMIQAIRRGDLAAVRLLAAKRAEVNDSAPDGTTPLHAAVEEDSVPAVELLIKAGANVNAVTRYGVTPLYLACLNGNTAVIEKLLANGASANAASPQGETALMTVARNGNRDAVRVLLARGADPNAKEKWKGQTALMWAAALNNAATAGALIEGGADVNARTPGSAFTPLLFAARGGHVDVARVLLDAGADVNERLPNGTSALVLAVINAHYEMADVFVDRGADVNDDAQGWTALHQIVWSRRPSTGSYPGAVPTGNVDSLDLVRKLLRRGANINARQKAEPRDGNRNLLNRIGATPFLLAAKAVDVPLMRLLLESGADPTLTADDGTTALMVAAGVGIWAAGDDPGTEEEALEAVKLVYEAGGGTALDVDKNGETPLHGAIYRAGSIPLAKFFIDRGAKFDVVNKKGWTPLIVADGVEYQANVLKRYPETAEFLRDEMRKQGLPVPTPDEAFKILGNRSPRSRQQ